MGRGVVTDMGPSVVIDTGKVEIAVISRHVEPSDLNCFLALGIDPMQKRYLMLKSRIHWRAGLGPMARPSSTAPAIGWAILAAVPVVACPRRRASSSIR